MNEGVKVQKETSFIVRNITIKYIQKLHVIIIVKCMWAYASNTMTFGARGGARVLHNSYRNISSLFNYFLLNHNECSLLGQPTLGTV